VFPRLCSRSVIYSSSCTLPLSSLCLDHRLYADDTQLFSTHSTSTQAFLTFKTLFNRSLTGWLPIFLRLTHLRLNCCSWNSIPTCQLSLDTSHCARTHGFIFDNILLSLTKVHLSPKPVTITFVHFAVFGLTSIRQLPVPLLPLSSTPNWTTVTISTINFLSLNYPVSSIRNSLTRTVTVISLPPYALSTAWLRITERIEYKLLSLTYITRPTVFPLIEAPGFY